MNTGFDVAGSRSPSEFARLAKPNPSALFAVAGRYEPSTFASTDGLMSTTTAASSSSVVLPGSGYRYRIAEGEIRLDKAAP
jgi:hypothetical protein